MLDMLDINDVSMQLAHKPILQHCSLHVGDRERVGLIGASGSGKSMLLRASMGLVDPRAKVQGSIRLLNHEMFSATDSELADIRGRYVGMIFQQADRALHPMLTVLQQVELPLIMHYQLSAEDRKDRVIRMVRRVGLSESVLYKRTFALSGGQQQRVAIATALITSPRLILADEPTTALDSITQQEILDMLTELVDDMGASMLLVTHDFSVLARCTSRSYVLDHGNIVEHATTQQLLEGARNDVSRRLVDAACMLTLHDHTASHSTTYDNDRNSVTRSEHTQQEMNQALQVCSTTDNKNVIKSKVLCELHDVSVLLGEKQRIRALDHVSLTINRGESVALIGGSGSGKTTLARTLLGLEQVSEGNVYYDGKHLRQPGVLDALHSQAALVFQHPFAALDPCWNVMQSISEPLILQSKRHATQYTQEYRKQVEEVLKLVGLDPETFMQRYPNQLSGGQAQCVSIARALIAQPKLLIADEPMSAIDVVERMNILHALRASRQAREQMTCIFISHDLGMIAQLAQRVIVLYEGHIVEKGSIDDILNRPQHDYTKQLVKAATLN